MLLARVAAQTQLEIDWSPADLWIWNCVWLAWGLPRRCVRRAYCASILMLASLMSLPKRSYSARLSVANCSGVRLPGSPPKPLSLV